MVQTVAAYVACGWRDRTFKREIAVMALLFWAVLTLRVFWFADAILIGALGTAYGTASTSIWLYVAAAFGMDAFSKQIRREES